jgi:metal-responsive CopG/Arc/MetJ family transcriptional regulator
MVVGITLPRKLLSRVEDNVKRLRGVTSRAKLLGLLVQYHLEDQDDMQKRIMNRFMRLFAKCLNRENSAKENLELVFVHAHMTPEVVNRLDAHAEVLGQSRSEAAKISIEMALDENEFFIKWLVPVVVPILQTFECTQSPQVQSETHCTQSNT